MVAAASKKSVLFIDKSTLISIGGSDSLPDVQGYILFDFEIRPELAIISRSRNSDLPVATPRYLPNKRKNDG
jgi:hypothetical protein